MIKEMKKLTSLQREDFTKLTSVSVRFSQLEFTEKWDMQRKEDTCLNLKWKTTVSKETEKQQRKAIETAYIPLENNIKTTAGD